MRVCSSPGIRCPAPGPSVSVQRNGPGASLLVLQARDLRCTWYGLDGDGLEWDAWEVFRDLPIMKDEPELRRFLESTPDLGVLIEEARQAASAVFGEEAAFHLEWFVDPESSVPSSRVYLVIETPLSVEDANRRMDEFDECWWLENSHRADGRLSVALEYAEGSST